MQVLKHKTMKKFLNFMQVIIYLFTNYILYILFTIRIYIFILNNIPYVISVTLALSHIYKLINLLIKT